MTTIELLEQKFLGLNVLITQDDPPKIYKGAVQSIYSEFNNYHADSLYFEIDGYIVPIEPDSNIEII